jgi:hypothetical protein
MIAVKPSARRCFLYSLVFVIPLLGGVVAEAATYYVAKTGSDAVSCATSQNIGTPKLTINSALGCLTTAGDNLFIRTGTYVESIIWTSIPGQGTQANRITIAHYQNEVVTMAPGPGACRGINLNKQWFTVDGINLYGGNMTVAGCPSVGGGNLLETDGGSGPGMTFRNMDIDHSPNSNMLSGDQLTFENNRVHYTGWAAEQRGYANGANGIYAAEIWNSLIRHNVFDDNMCFGLRVFNSFPSTHHAANDNIIEYNTAHTNGVGKGLGGGPNICSSLGGGFVIGDDNNVVRNNLSYNNNSRGMWVYASQQLTRGTKFYHNTITLNPYGLQTQPNTTGTVITNNIIVGNTTANISDGGTGTTFTTNKTTGAITDCTVSTVNFRLKAGAPCIDAGTTIDTVTSDFAGFPRPQGAAYDIGAYEMSGTDTAEPMAPRGLTVQ